MREGSFTGFTSDRKILLALNYWTCPKHMSREGALLSLFILLFGPNKGLDLTRFQMFLT